MTGPNGARPVSTRLGATPNDADTATRARRMLRAAARPAPGGDRPDEAEIARRARRLQTAAALAWAVVAGGAFGVWVCLLVSEARARFDALFAALAP